MYYMGYINMYRYMYIYLYRYMYIYIYRYIYIYIKYLFVKSTERSRISRAPIVGSRRIRKRRQKKKNRDKLEI